MQSDEGGSSPVSDTQWLFGYGQVTTSKYPPLGN